MSAPAALLRGRRRVAPIALGLAVLGAAAIAVVSLVGTDGEGRRRSAGAGGRTAEVTRQTLVQRETVDGTLGFAGGRTVINRLGTGGSGGDGSGSDSPAAADASTASPTTAVASFALDQTAPDEQDEQPDDEAEQPDEEPEQPDEEPEQRDDEPEQPDDRQEQPGADEPEGDQQEQPAQPDSAQPDTSTGARPSGSSDTPSGDDTSSDAGSGTVTALARSGSVVERGGTLYRLDGDPIVLMYGSTPAYRSLRSGASGGRDVRQLERNLAALGFDPGTVDDTYDSGTAAAVGDLQESVGLERTGTVELGRVVFLPGPRRIGEHKASVGDVLGAGAEVLETTSTRRVVTVDLDATLQDLAQAGAGVEVTLPDGHLIRGRITEVGRVATEVEDSSADPNAAKQFVIDVTIRLRSERGLGELDEAPVGVGLAKESRRHVLAVPINALVARRGGGYGVELAGSHRIVPVEAGLFADGDVEVTGAGIREGTRVAVPSE